MDGDNVYTRTFNFWVTFFQDLYTNSITLIVSTATFLWNLGFYWWFFLALFALFFGSIIFMIIWINFSFVLILLGYLEMEGQ